MMPNCNILGPVAQRIDSLFGDISFDVRTMELWILHFMKNSKINHCCVMAILFAPRVPGAAAIEVCRYGNAIGPLACEWYGRLGPSSIHALEWLATCAAAAGSHSVPETLPRRR